jgi:hypothetical protein
LNDAQARYALTFPEDLLTLLRDRRIEGGYNWSVEDPAIRRMLAWPLEMLSRDVDQGLWWPDWGERPDKGAERREVLREALGRAPKLIPLYSHRFLPEQPAGPGNPVFSMHGFDTVYYGVDLADYFAREFGSHPEPVEMPVRKVPFWSELVEDFERVCSFDDDRAGKTPQPDLR